MDSGGYESQHHPGCSVIIPEAAQHHERQEGSKEESQCYPDHAGKDVQSILASSVKLSLEA